jgi:hypothetical protein
LAFILTLSPPICPDSNTLGHQWKIYRWEKFIPANRRGKAFANTSEEWFRKSLFRTKSIEKFLSIIDNTVYESGLSPWIFG